LRNSIGQEIDKGDRVLHVSRHGSNLQFKVGNVTGFGERKMYYRQNPDVTVLIDYDGKTYGPSRGVGLDKVFKLAL
jgi:hypothetical protein